MSPRAVLASLAAVVAFALPGPAEACAVCMSGREDEVQLAFILTTLLMSVLPLIVVGGFVWWLRRRLRQMESTQAARRPVTPIG